MPLKPEQTHSRRAFFRRRETQDVCSAMCLRSGDLLLGVLLHPFGHFFDLLRLFVDGLLRHLLGCLVLAMLQFDLGLAMAPR